MGQGPESERMGADDRNRSTKDEGEDGRGGTPGVGGPKPPQRSEGAKVGRRELLSVAVCVRQRIVKSPRNEGSGVEKFGDAPLQPRSPRTQIL